MQHNLNKATETSANDRQGRSAQAQSPQYATPVIYVIGRSHDLLQGSGRHKNDDTGSRGFEVDQR